MGKGQPAEHTIESYHGNYKSKRNTDLFTPAYFKISEDLKEKIFSGQLKPGDMLPSETEICREYKVSRMTARQGIRLLAEEGLAESQRGRGSFVTSPNLNDLTVTLPDDYFRSLGRDNIKLLSAEICKAGSEIAGILAVPKEKKLLCISKLHFSNGLPAAVDSRYILYHKGKPIVEKEIQYAAMPEVVSKMTDLTIKQNRLTISSVLLDKETAELLRGQPKDPALKIEQLVLGGNNIPLGYSLTICHGERFSMTAKSKSFL